MIRARTTVLIGIAMTLFLSALGVSRAHAQTSGTAADSAQIKQVIKSYYENFGRHDPHAVSMLFSEDADAINLLGAYTHGRSTIQARMESLFAGNLKSAQRTGLVKRIRFFSPTLAVVDADSTISGALAANGSVLQSRKGLITLVMTKQNGHWFISVFHEMEFPAAPGPRRLGRAGK
jgi:uncharacterized protein (TIGR02246 family)